MLCTLCTILSALDNNTPITDIIEQARDILDFKLALREAFLDLSACFTASSADIFADLACS